VEDETDGGPITRRASLRVEEADVAVHLPDEREALAQLQEELRQLADDGALDVGLAQRGAVLQPEEVQKATRVGLLDLAEGLVVRPAQAR